MKQNRDHLIPTPRTDKNGRTVTRHLKPGTETNNADPLKPASPITPPITRKRRKLLEQEAATALATQGSSHPTNELESTIQAKNYQRLLAILPAFSNETLQRFITASTTEIGWSLNEFLLNAQPNEAYINDWITMEPAAHEADIDSLTILQGLAKYKHLAPQKKGHYPTRRIEQVTAITRATIHLFNTDNGVVFGANEQQGMMRYIEDEKLRDLLTKHENPNTIADIISTRNLTDPEQITALYETMNSTANAISDGSL